MTEELMREAIILLLQDLHERKKSVNPLKNYSRSLLDRLGAPYYSEVEQVPTEEQTPSQIGSNWLIEWSNDAKDEVDNLIKDMRYRKNEVDNLIPERQGRDGLSLDIPALIAERDEWRNHCKAMETCWTETQEQRDQAQQRVAYLESEYDRLREKCEKLMEVNIRLRKEKNDEAVKRIEEGVA